MPKEIIESNKQSITPRNLPTRYIPYPSLEFTIPQKEKALNQIGPILIQIDMQLAYKCIIKESVQSINDDRLRIAPPHKRLL